MEKKGFALVTGAAVRVGREIALFLAKQGYEVGVNYNQSGVSAEMVVEEIRMLGGMAESYQADLTSEEEILKIAQAIRDKEKRLTVLINSAGIMPRGTFLDSSHDMWEKTMGINLNAVWYLSKHLYQCLERNNGVIINIGESGVNKYWSNYPLYLVSKTALHKMSQLMAKEFAPNVRVNLIAPGLMQKSEEMDDAIWADLVNKTPLKKEVATADFLKTIQFCINNQSLTGEIITVDGGYQLV